MKDDASDQKIKLPSPGEEKLWRSPRYHLELVMLSRGWQVSTELARSASFHRIGSGVAKPHAQTLGPCSIGSFSDIRNSKVTSGPPTH